MNRFLVIILLLCALTSCERPGYNAKYVSARILDEPKYLDIELSVVDYGDEIYRRPRDVFYIGKVKQSVLDTSDRFIADEFYVEYHGSIGEIEGIHHYLNVDSVNHIYLALDTSVDLEVLNRIYDYSYELLVHVIHANPTGSYNETYLHRGSCLEYIAGKVIVRNAEFVLIEDGICYNDQKAYSNCDSMMSDITKRLRAVNEKNICRDCAFTTWKLGPDTIDYQLPYWDDQLSSAKKYGIDTSFFAGIRNAWRDLRDALIRSEEAYIYAPADYNMIILRESPTRVGSSYYKFANECLTVLRRSWASFLKVEHDNVPSLLMRPEIYYGDWRVVDYPLMRLYDGWLIDARRNYLPPEPYIE